MDDDDLASHGASSAVDQTSSRLWSCLRCKRRKQRCDKRLPTCTPCRKSGLECTGMLREATDRKGMMTALLEREAALEAELQAQRSQQPELISTTPSPSPSDENGGSKSAAGAEVVSATLVPDTGSATDSHMSMNHVSLSAVAEPRNRAGEFLKHLSTPRLVTGVTETFGGNPESTGRVDQLWEAISQYIRHPSGSMQRLYIPGDETRKALNTYLEVVDFRYPRLPVEKVRSGMSVISAEDGERAYNELINTSPAHVFMAYLVVAIVPLVSDSYPISQGSWVSAHLLSKCLKLLNRVFLQEDGVDIIQCLHLLIILSIHCSTAGSAWHLIGFALNKCIALGYHLEEPRAIASLSETDIQQRRWAFWGCYLLDRLVCAGLGRPFSIGDEDIFVPLPSELYVSGTSVAANNHTAKDTTTADTLKLQTRAYIHLFRYATLLSSTAQERCSPDQNETSPCASFDDLLGQALYWRATSPTRGDPSMSDMHSYQMSLYNTLLLRAAIREINDGFVLVYPGLHDGVISDDSVRSSQGPFLRHKSSASHIGIGQTRDDDLASSTASRVFNHEKDRMHRINLISICRAVARSLDRSRMTSRPYLSFLTGYSSLSMGLACLFHLTVSQFAIGYETNVAMFRSIPPSAHIDSMLPRKPSFLSDPSPSTERDSRQRSHTKNPYWNSEQRLYADPQALVDLACRKLEVAGRQFPRLQEYRMTLEKIRDLVCLWSTWCYSEAAEPSMQEQIGELRQTTDDIGPPHLKALAQAILYLLAL